MRSPLFWDVTQHTQPIIYRRFETTYRSHLLELLEPWRCDRQVVPKRRYQATNQGCVTSQKGKDLKKSKMLLLSFEMWHTILYVHHKTITVEILHFPRATDIFRDLPQCHRYSWGRDSAAGVASRLRAGKPKNGCEILTAVWGFYEGWNFNFGNTPLDWMKELLEWRANAAGRMGPSPTYVHNGSGPSRNGHTQ